MWFKKKAYIIGYNSNTAADGTDWRTVGKIQNWTPSQTLPSAADANNYFYLPAFGYYSSGQLRYVGYHGHYWSSSANPWNSYYAFGLYFVSGTVLMSDGYGRDSGFRAEAFQ